jgi:hypothetical protein
MLQRNLETILYVIVKVDVSTGPKVILLLMRTIIHPPLHLSFHLSEPLTV